MNRRSVIIYWLLLLIPTLIVGVSAFYLLRHEQQRINQSSRQFARDRAQSIAETLQLSVRSVEDELTGELKRIPREKLKETLLAWEDKNPLIRNVFIWKPKAGLQYPSPDLPSTSEGGRFVTRYHAFFSGRVAWTSTGNKVPESVNIVKAQESASGTRQNLLDLAKGDYSKSQGNDWKNKGHQEDGWICWFSENRLYVMGWVQREPDGLIYGVELELMTLLSRLISGFPADVSKGTVYALIDSNGQILHQSGDGLLKPASRPELALNLAPYLPNWQVAVYFVEGGPAVGSGKGFLILSALLLLIFIAAIIIGGTLLILQAHRNMIDALQKTTFVSNVSHELKTPLTSIRMYAELLHEDRVRDPEKRRRYLQVIVDESQRLTRLVNNVLDFSRLEQGCKRYSIEDLELKGFIKGIIDTQRPRFQEQGIDVEYEAPESDVVVHTDRDALGQVVLNLLDNALKYAADGKEITLALTVSERDVRIQVMDRGPGISPAHRSKVFEKFHRVDDSLTIKHPGSGMGLSIARQLMRGMGGDVTFEPRQDGGSCFNISMPLRVSVDMNAS